jgi:hypothetical protein
MRLCCGRKQRGHRGSSPNLVGRPKDVLIGLSVGALIGAAVGIAFGIVEGSGAEPRGHGARRGRRALAERGVKLTLFAAPGRGRVPALGPGLIARF